MIRILKSVSILSVFIIAISFILAGNNVDWREQAREKITRLTHKPAQQVFESKQKDRVLRTYPKTLATKRATKSAGSKAKAVTPGERIARHREMLMKIKAADLDSQADFKTTTGVATATGTGGISGFVFDSDGVTKLDYYDVEAFDEYGFYVADETIQGDGSYQIMDLPPGDYYVLAEASGYIDEFYDNVTDWRLATLVTVSDGQTTSGIDFTLDRGKVISGRLFETNGTTPIAYTEAYFHLYDMSSHYEWDYQSYYSYTSTDGGYTISGISPGDKKLHVYVGGYTPEYYGGADNLAAATIFTVSATADTTYSIDFILDLFTAIDDGYEQNNNYETATPISYGDSIEAVINPAGDEDWFIFTGQEGDTITADIDADVTGSWLDSYLYLYDSTGTYLLTDNDDFDGLDSRIDQYILPYTGDYYLQVKDFGNPDGGDDYWYVLRLIEGSIPMTPLTPDVYEPNDSPITASQIDYGDTVIATINPAGDVDYFIFTGQAGDTVTADITTSYDYWSDLDSYLELLDSSGTVLAENDDWDGLDSRIEGYILPYTGDYYLMVYDWSHAGGELYYTYTLVFFEGILFEATGAIAGMVFQEDGITPAGNAGWVEAYNDSTYWYQGDAEISFWGDYIITGLPPGEYLVRIYYDSEGPDEYIDEWFDGAVTIAQATPVGVIASDTTTDINFVRKIGSTVQGFVSVPEGYESYYYEEPLFLLYDVPTGEYVLDDWGITFAGGYRLTGIPAGTYKLAFISLFTDLALMYSGGGHSFDDPLSQTITVTSGDILDVSLMTLETAGGIISGTVYDESGLPATTYDDEDLLIIVYDTTGHFVQAAYVGWNPMTGAPTSPGTYQVAGLRTGGYYVLLIAEWTDIMPQWYSGVPSGNLYGEYQLFSPTIPPGATAVEVTDPGETADIDFNLGSAAAVDDEKDGVPQAFKLEQNYPNPFNPSTMLSFDVPRRGHVVVMVYDLLGREVIRLVDSDMSPGRHRVIWNGRSASGRDVPTGLYIIRMVAPEYTKSIKAVYLK
ncbi:MAG: carboxypeptidase regulatory-like domain-containing protein [Fidelibacterota bacterium]|nr:MAG: carboxypeptidase regulatory-like domain-containing protein [Candidatus Neomarinimicrobiota bacterium]